MANTDEPGYCTEVVIWLFTWPSVASSYSSAAWLNSSRDAISTQGHHGVCGFADNPWPPANPDTDWDWQSDLGSDPDEPLGIIPEDQATQGGHGPTASTQAGGTTASLSLVPKDALPLHPSKDMQLYQQELSFELEQAMPGFIRAVRWGTF